MKLRITRKKQANGALDGAGEPPLVTPKATVQEAPKAAKAAKAGAKDENSGKQGFIARITSLASSKSKKTKPGRIENGAGVPAALQVSKSEEELRNAFRVYDADNDGRISHAELRNVLTSLDGEISEQEVEQLMKQIDTDNDGSICVDEFIKFHQAGAAPLAVGGGVSPVHDPMRDAFQMFDKDGDSRISAAELQSVLVSLGDKNHSIEQCKQMIRSVDKDGDGYVDFMEFQVLMGGHED